MDNRKTVLHIGCGLSPLPFFLQAHKEVRLDLNPDFKPDIIADMTDLPDGIGPFDMVYASHCLEHIPVFKVEPCLRGWRRVLKPGGAVLIFVPDLQGVTADNKPLYWLDAETPICGFDLIYGCRYNMEAYPYFEHKCGFVSETLHECLLQAGFVDVKTTRISDPYPYNLVGFGRRGETDE